MTPPRPADVRRTTDPDAALLARFARDREPAAFAELVRRHGGLVLGVCRRVAGHPDDADDAFQAVFLVLSRRAGSVRRPELLGNFLYGVAYRIARKARRRATRRREVPLAVDPVVPAMESHADLWPVLDAELARLPAWYRDAVLLCDVQGVPRGEAAKRLGVPEGTLSSRLAAGRRRLSVALARRGVTLSVPFALIAAERVPAALIERVVESVTTGPASAGVLTLAHEGRPWMWAKLAATAATVGGLAVGWAAVAGPDQEPPAKKQEPPAKAADAPAAEKPAGAVGKPRLAKAVDVPITQPGEPAWSPDGRFLAVPGQRVVPPRQENPGTAPVYRTAVAVVDSRPPHLTTSIPLGDGEFVGWTPDGAMMTELRERTLISGVHNLTLWKIDTNPQPAPGGPGAFGGMPGGGGPGMAAEAFRTVDLPVADGYGHHLSADGKSYRTVVASRSQSERVVTDLSVVEVRADVGRASNPLVFVQGPLTGYIVAAAGKRLVTVGKDAAVSVWDVDAGRNLWETQPLVAEPKPSDVARAADAAQRLVIGNLEVRGIYPSPDGSRVLVSFSRTSKIRGAIGPGPGEGTSNHLVLLDGTTGKVLPDAWPFNAKAYSARTASFSRDNRLLAVGMYADGRDARAFGDGGPVTVVWDLTANVLVQSWNGYGTLAFAPDRDVLAVVERKRSESRVGFWEFAHAK